MKRIDDPRADPVLRVEYSSRLTDSQRDPSKFGEELVKLVFGEFELVGFVYQKLRSFEDSHGYVSEFFARDALFRQFETITATMIDLFFDSLTESLPACAENGYMRRLEVNEILGRIRGTFKPKDSAMDRASHPLQHLYFPRLPVVTTNSIETQKNGTFMNQWSGTANAYNKVPELNASINKLKGVLNQIRSAAKPGSRESQLPLTSPILKLSLLEDPKDTGEVNEDLMVRIYKEAFPIMSEAELHQVLALGRVGNVRERRVDYMKMLATLERLFQVPVH